MRRCKIVKYFRKICGVGGKGYAIKYDHRLCDPTDIVSRERRRYNSRPRYCGADEDTAQVYTQDIIEAAGGEVNWIHTGVTGRILPDETVGEDYTAGNTKYHGTLFKVSSAA